MIQGVFLIVVGIVYLLVASVSDLKKREIANWLVFSFLAFGLAYRAFFSLFNNNINFFLFGLEGLVFCSIIALLFYYGRVFAGGDTKLLIAIGPYIAIANGYIENIYLLVGFIFLLMLGGSIYSIIYSLGVSFTCKNFWRKFVRRCRKNKRLFYWYLIATLFFVLLSFAVYFYLNSSIFFLFPILFFLFPFLYIYAKTIEEDCFIRIVGWKDVTVGDWLVEEIRIGRRVIRPYWEGLSEEEVRMIRKAKKKARIKYGIPFIPSFLIGFILLLIFKENILNYLAYLF